ncbi:unnamed protein product [Rotaria sp. Silwood1]|nr:unnamed protein product [Rotaria sp. Silwood1]
MSTKVSTHHKVFGLILIICCLFLGIRLNFHPLRFIILQKSFNSSCLQWNPIDQRLYETYNCSDRIQINSFIWTYNGTGLMKYIQWIITRRLGNIIITQLNNDCHIIQQNYFSSNSTNKTFVLIYIMSLSANLTNESSCSIMINQMARINLRYMNQIYFKRKSILATLLFQQLDSIKENINRTYNLNISMEDNITKAIYTTKYFPNFFTSIPSIKWIVIDAEDLIKTNLSDCEKILTNFISLLGLSNSSLDLKNIIEYDSHQFLEDSTWWDQSNVIENIYNISIPSRSLNFTYSNDFYYLHGDRSFTQYLYENRQCYNDGIFAQMQSETITNRNSTDQPNRCLLKSFDCAFSDLYSLQDREQLYQQSYPTPIKCGFTIPSIFDKIRNRYGRNHTCETIIYTCVTNCYDPLPQVRGDIHSSFCFVALLDTRTINAYKNLSLTNSSVRWDLIDLGVNATPFSVAAKSTETLKTIGQRLFPLAKWLIWLDGKGQINDIGELLKEVRAPVMSVRHPIPERNPASEVYPTIIHVSAKEMAFPQRLNNIVIDIDLQQKQYNRDGFYQRSNILNLTLYDIAIFIYRNNHPCIFRYSCGWHNEINYFSYRGQLSVYYPAVRLNLTDYLHFLPEKFYTTFRHRLVC